MQKIGALKELINICFHMVFATQMSSGNDYLYN
jgi:hypothetical protein